MYYLIIISIFFSNILLSQTELQLQYRNRGEFNNSLTKFSNEDLNTNYSTGQRTRIGFFHNSEDYNLGFQIQDVRFWGQDRSTIAPKSDPSSDGLLIHQAYLNIRLNKLFNFNSGIKIGRQEINFDDVRLFGNLNWLHQARRHDIAILSLDPNETNSIKVGYAFNQNKFKSNGSIFNGVGGIYPSGTNGLSQNYKTLALLFYENSNDIIPFKLLFANDNFSELDTSMNPTTEVFGRYTTGLKLSKKIDAFTANLAYYQQMGTTPTGSDLSANMINVDATYNFGKFAATLAYDYLSGTDMVDGINPTTEVNTFDPLYGTAHKFFGFMDFFYAPINNGLNGFSDANLKLNYKQNDKLNFHLATHIFSLTNTVIENGAELDAMLGTEIDFVTKYKLFDKVELELGVLFMLAEDSLYSPSVMNISDPNKSPYMIYFMVNLVDVLKL